MVPQEIDLKVYFNYVKPHKNWADSDKFEKIMRNRKTCYDYTNWGQLKYQLLNGNKPLSTNCKSISIHTQTFSVLLFQDNYNYPWSCFEFLKVLAQNQSGFY